MNQVHSVLDVLIKASLVVSRLAIAWTLLAPPPGAMGCL